MQYEHRITTNITATRKFDWIATGARASAAALVLALGTSVLWPSHALADIGQFVGAWQNVNSHDRGVIRLTVAHQGNAVTVHVWGHCTPTPCDWGQVPAVQYGSGVQSTLPQQAQVLRAEYNQNFARRQVIIHHAGNQLRVEVLTHFTDNSGRSNYADTDLFNRVTAPGPGAQIGNEDCVAFNPATAHAALVQGSWKLVDGNHWILDFGNKQAEAQRAEQIVKRYNLNKQCFVGRPNPSFTYWLVGNQSPAGGMQGEDCVGFNPATTQASSAGGMWRMVDGNHAMFSFPNQAEAQRAVQIVKHYGFTQSCFVGRPAPSMSYLRK